MSNDKQPLIPAVHKAVQTHGGSLTRSMINGVLNEGVDPNSKEARLKFDFMLTKVQKEQLYKQLEEALNMTQTSTASVSSTSYNAKQNSVVSDKNDTPVVSTPVQNSKPTPSN